MLKLNSSVSALTNIGPKYQKLLENLEIKTIKDLLYHFPFRYDDFSNIKKVNELGIGDIITVEAVIGSVNNIYTKNGRRLTIAKAADYTGNLDIVWFNQHYLKSVLKIGKTYYFSGKVDTFSNKLCLISPDMELKVGDNAQNVNTGRLVPIYSETAGVSSRWLRARINDIIQRLENLEGLAEFIPTNILEKENLQNIKWSFNQIHFPNSELEAGIARDRFVFEEFFLELLNVETRKNDWKRLKLKKTFKNHEKDISAFIANLPFRLTNSQEQAVTEILADMQKEYPMNRLLEGDVGTGKTVVAVISAYFAHLNKSKTLYMAPTEILAKQHYDTFKNLLGGLLNIELITGSSKPKGNWDVLIGTHALLYSKEKYENVGLVVIDEQHRFGVEQRGKLLLGDDSSENADGTSTKNQPHLLTMTATPIPRTLALTLYGDLSISALKTHLNENRKITTKVVTEKHRETAYAWIKSKNEPTFIVCPFIEESDSASLENIKAAQVEYAKLKNGIFSGVSIGLLHGRMKPKEKAEIIEKFRTGEIKVLVSTPVIEVGIDVPDATIMVIESAERYGLASLHQLRGRVGRGSKEGFCFVFMGNSSQGSFSRLKHLETVNDGLELAEIDMKLRGIGDIFGTIQHGFKRFKIAQFSDMEMLEKAKMWAQKVFGEMEKYPLLKEKLAEDAQNLVKDN